MKGTILDFFKLVVEKPELAKDLAALITKHGFELTPDELSETELDSVAGGYADAGAAAKDVMLMGMKDVESALMEFAAEIDTSGQTKGSTPTQETNQTMQTMESGELQHRTELK